MSAIYQKARPLHWDEVVGQEHVRGVLEVALSKGKIGHAYLFSGPRGVGKTTTARLIAMTANCESVGVPKPCGVCSSCRQVIAGSHPDVFEIDAASNNSVDDVRDLREKVGLSSMYGGKKVYILDEAHMMTKSAFNALLKTLEEPPDHVVFILATTEPERILPTILSRCQHYRFRRLSEKEIAGKLERILRDEGTEFESDALLLIGRLADGAMRDGESLLERMLAGGEAVTLHAVEDALGLPPAQRMRTLAAGLLERDPEPVLRAAGELYREGFAARSVVDGVKTALRHQLHSALGLEGGNPDPSVNSKDLLRLLATLDEQDSRFVRSSDSLALEMALTHAMLSLDAGNSSTVSSGLSAGTGSSASDPEMLSRLTRLERELSDLKRSGVGAAPLSRGDDGVLEFNPNVRSSRLQAPSSVVSGAGSSESVLPSSAQTSPAKGNWNDVLRLADTKTRAFLKPARAEFQDGHVIVFYDDKAKFHAKQISDKFDDLAALIGRAMSPVSVELITPEGRKKKFLTLSEAKGEASLGSSEKGEELPPRALQPEPSTAVPGVEPENTPSSQTQTPAALNAAPQIPPIQTSPPQTLPPQTPPARATSNAQKFFEDSPRVERAPPAPLPVAPPVENLPWKESDSPSSEPVSQPVPQVAPEPEVYDSVPLSSYDFAPLESAPDFEAPPVSSWDDVGVGSSRTPPARAQQERSSAAKNGPVSVQQHPLYDEVQKLFPRSQVRAKGKVKPKAIPRAEEEGEDEGVSAEV
ncbi:MAG: DNA polymerase III subunit gamma/tau [Pseudopedobacter sp.]|nr:DNA polymerase III subunit gamma/tau [Deinococcales bacterium]